MEEPTPLAGPRDLPVIAVEGEDDVAAVCGKMDARSEPQVILYVKRNQAFRDPLTFNRIRRHAHLTGKAAIIVSQAAGVRALATRAGMPAFPSVREGERWAAGSGRLSFFGQSFEFPWFSRRTLTATTGVVAAGVALLAALALLGPSATVTLRPELTPVEVRPFSVIADLDVDRADIDAALIPAQTVERDITVELAVEATGEGFVGDDLASGTVTLFNYTTEELTIPEGLQVSTPEGVAFFTTEEVTIPPGPESFAPAEVTALLPGEEGNVDSQTISEVEGDLSGDVDVLNNDPFEGGTDRPATLVTRDDLDRLTALVSAAVQERGVTRLNEAFGDDSADPRVIFPETLDSVILGTEVTPGLDEEGDFVFATTTARLSVLAVRHRDIQAYAAAFFTAEQEEDLSVAPGTILFNVTEIGEASESLSSVEFSFQASGMASSTIDEDEVKELVAGESEAGAKEALAERYRLREPAEIELSPAIFDWVPGFDFRLDVRVESEP
ncbi:MAG: baseplate J/gp47 family protein [Dehalococcoidia bacterium]